MIARSLLVAALVATASPASAQSWLERAARGAVESAAQGAVSNMINGAARRPDERPAAAAPAGAPSPRSEGAAAVPASAMTFAAPSPINYRPSLSGPYQLEFSPELEGAEAVFDAFNRVACTGCEGGRSYDSWIKHHVPDLQGNGALERRISEMAIGEAIRWNGVSGARLALTVISEEPIGAWPCKQVRWSSEREQESAERLGLFCHGKRGDYLGDGWVEVL